MSEKRSGEDVRILHVEDTMRRQPITVDGRASIASAIAVMKQTKNSCLVIRPRWSGDAYGILTAREIAGKAVGAGPKRLNFSEHTVSEIMTKPAIVAGPDLEVKYAVRLLTGSAAAGLIVLKNGELAGTLVLEDVFAAL